MTDQKVRAVPKLVVCNDKGRAEHHFDTQRNEQKDREKQPEVDAAQFA